MKWIVVFTMFSFSSVNAQDDKNEDPSRLSVKEISLTANATSPETVKFPFKQVRVIDSRLDTSKIGFDQNPIGWVKNAFKVLRVKDGFSMAVGNYYNSYYENSFDHSELTLVIVIKKFWISEIDYDAVKQKVMYGGRAQTKKIRCKFEYYLNKDEKYLPVKRLDTTFNWDNDLIKYVREEFDEKKQQFIKFSLKAMIEVIDYEKAVKAFAQQTGKTFSEINDFNTRRLNFSVLKDSNIAKGVFLTFEEFKNNKPGIVLFEEKEMKYGVRKTEHYIDDSNGNLISSYWGYCNGESLKFGTHLNSKAFRKQDAFYFFVKTVTYDYDNSQTSVGPYTVNTRRKTKEQEWVPFQIDMETGEVY